MTLLPCPRIEIAVYDGPLVVEPQDETVCAHPACGEGWGLERHHVVRRSETGGPERWVVVNGVILLNERWLCHIHHVMVTGEVGGHRGWIRYLEGHGWVWYAPAPPGHAASGGVPDKLGCLWLPVGPLKGVM